MSIRFMCAACRTVLKIGEMIVEPRKVRCTGCGIVILVEPDPVNPLGVVSSIPEQPDKTKRRIQAEQKRRQIILWGSLAALAIILGFGVWWSQRGPADRGAIEGDVTVDGAPLERGTIVFVPGDASKASVGVPISRGSYSISAARGPFIGKNKVEITGSESEKIAARWNTESTKTIEIKAGGNKENFAATSK